MEIKITTNSILKVLQILSWVIFIGLCVEAGATIVNTFITLFINPLGVHNFWEGADYLSSLYTLDQSYFVVITIVMIIIGVLKALMFYFIVKLFSEKQLNLSQPFSMELSKFMLKLSYFSLGIGLFSHCGAEYSSWLTQQGAPVADLQLLHFSGADVWLFMTIILFVIVQIVKKGIELQNENDLTI